MSSSQPPGTASTMQLGQAVSVYLGTLPPAEREVQAPMLLRFSRWLSPDRDLHAIMPIELERYQEQLGEVGIDPTRSLEGLKSFLADAKKKGWTDDQPGPPHQDPAEGVGEPVGVELVGHRGARRDDPGGPRGAAAGAKPAAA